MEAQDLDHDTGTDESGDEYLSQPLVARKRTPAERKALDYAKQRRNTYGENPEGSRKNIRRGKKRGIRVQRRKVAQELLQGEDSDAGRIRRTRFHL